MATTISSPSSVFPTTNNAFRAFGLDGVTTGLFNQSSADTVYSGFTSLSIPSGATINGIEVIVHASSNSTLLRVVLNDGTSYSSLRATNGLPGKTLATVDPCWGSSSDLWGLSWTPATAAALILRFDWSTLTSGKVIKFDHIQVRVTFTAAASTTVHSVNNVAEANIASIKGVAHASIGEVNTVTFD